MLGPSLTEFAIPMVAFSKPWPLMQVMPYLEWHEHCGQVEQALFRLGISTSRSPKAWLFL